MTEWFPQNERALATGIFNAGSNLGAILTPLIVPWIVVHFGWRWAFSLTGGVGFLGLVLWIAIYRRPENHPWCSASELDYIRGGKELSAAWVNWAALLQMRQTWAFVAAKFLTDPIWWFYLYWRLDFCKESTD